MLVPLSNWHDPDKRRIEAVRAANERNDVKLLELLEVYLALKSRKRATLSPGTLQYYKRAVRSYLSWAWSDTQALNILRITSDDIDRYIWHLQTTGSPLTRKPLKPGTIATHVAGVRALYRALEWARAATVPEVRSPSDPTPPEERRPALPEELYKKLLQYLSGTDATSTRDRVAVRLMAEAGLRISEVVALAVEDIDLSQRLLVVRSGKGGKQRTVPLGKSLVRDIEAWLKLRQAYAKEQEHALLVNIGERRAHGRAIHKDTLRRHLNHHYRNLGFPARYYGAHMLRHTAGTRFYRTSRDLHATARLLGHSNVNTSAIYAKMDLSGLRALVDGLDAWQGRVAEVC